MKAINITLWVCWIVFGLLAVGAVWDLTLSAFWGWPSFCDHLRHWNTASNDLLAMALLWTDVYLWLSWRHLNGGFSWDQRDSRLLFLACALAALWWHLFGLWMLHGVHIQGVRL